jgi:hypothetical protein
MILDAGNPSVDGCVNAGGDAFADVDVEVDCCWGDGVDTLDTDCGEADNGVSGCRCGCCCDNDEAACCSPNQVLAK